MLTRRNALLGMAGLIAGGGAAIGTGVVTSGEPDARIVFTTDAGSGQLTLVPRYLATGEYRNVATDGQITMTLPTLPTDPPVALTEILQVRNDSDRPVFVHRSRETNESPPPVAVSAVSRQGSDTTGLVRDAPDSALTAPTTIDQPRNAVRVPEGFSISLTVRVTTTAAASPFRETVPLHARSNPPPDSPF